MGGKVNWEKGFTLLELSIALVIMAALSYTITLGVGASRDYVKYNENRQYLESVRSALLTFVQTNGYLPCPDTATTPDGIEDRTTNICNDKNGYLPYSMLGVNSKDAWGNPLYYTINSRADISGTKDIATNTESAAYFYNVNAPAFNKLTKPFGTTKGAGNLTICGEAVTSCTGSTPAVDVIESQAIAVVVSFGKNGANTWAKYKVGSVNSLDNAEKENADDDNYFWQSVGSNVSGSEFDDQLIWLTGYDVKYALLRSERGLQ